MEIEARLKEIQHWEIEERLSWSRGMEIEARLQEIQHEEIELESGDGD